MVASGNLKKITDHGKSLLTFTRAYYFRKNNLKLFFACSAHVLFYFKLLIFY